MVVIRVPFITVPFFPLFLLWARCWASSCPSLMCRMAVATCSCAGCFVLSCWCPWGKGCAGASGAGWGMRRLWSGGPARRVFGLLLCCLGRWRAVPVCLLRDTRPAWRRRRGPLPMAPHGPKLCLDWMLTTLPVLCSKPPFCHRSPCSRSTYFLRRSY